MFLTRAAAAPQISSEWTCAFCGEVYREGSECPKDNEHWDEFMIEMTRPHAHDLLGAA